MIERSKTFWNLFCESLPLTVNLGIPTQGYTPGQSIPVTVHVKNESAVQVDAVRFRLFKVCLT